MTTAFTTDWHRLCGQAHVHSTVQTWWRAEPALAGLSIQAVLGRAQSSKGGLALSDATLGALFRLGHTDSLARRTALQAVVPRLVQVARRLADRGGVPDVVADLASLTWEELGHADGRWSGHLAARLVTQVERRYRLTWRCDRHEVPLDDDQVGLTGPGPDCCWLDVERVLQGAVLVGVIGLEAARILERVAFEGLTDAEIAAWRGGTTAAAKKARQRAVAALRTHGPVLALLAG